MAVIVQYIVVRNGEQKMTFTSKKEADAYDKVLDISDQMYTFLESAKLEMSATQLEELSFYMSKNREEVVGLLRGGTVKKVAAPAAVGSRAATGRKTAKTKKTAVSDSAAVASGA